MASQLPPLDGFNPKSYPPGSESPSGFRPDLGWSHYRALMRVENNPAHQSYETEAAQGNWSRRDLERQIPEDAEGVLGCPFDPLPLAGAIGSERGHGIQ